MSDLSNLRPPDAGTRNEWTFAGDGKVFAWKGGLPAVLGRTPPAGDGLVGIAARQYNLMITPHQARALLEILPAAIAMAEEEE